MNGKAGQRGPKYHRALGGRKATYTKYQAERPPMRPSTGASLYGERPTKERMRNKNIENLAGKARRGDYGCLLFDIAKTPAANLLRHGAQNATAFGVHWPKPVATMLVITRQTYRFCAGLLFGPA